MEKMIIDIKKSRNRLLAFSLSFFAIILFLSFIVLLYGDENYDFNTLFNVLSKNDTTEAAFSIMEIRLPKLLCAIIAGWSFGLSGFVFQTILGNPLASPDIIGVTSSSSFAAVLCILVFKTGKYFTGLFSVSAGLFSSLFLYFLSQKGGFSAARLILLGIGLQALMRAGISFLLLKAARYELPEVMRWLSGSLSYAKSDDIFLLFITSFIATAMILLFNKRLEVIELGEDIAIGVGSHPNLSRLILIISSVSLVAFSTAVTGPIACISFLSGPIALNFSKKRSPVLSGMTGIILVLLADISAQNILPARYPAGVITGLLGSPYLLYLLIKMNRRNSL